MASAFVDFLERYHKDGVEFLNHIVRVTGDETCVPFVNAETEEQSKKWIHTLHQTSRNSLKKRCLSARKLMATVFCDRKGVLMEEYMQQGATIMSEVYCETQKLRWTIQNKRRGMLTSGVVLLHENAHPHTAARTLALQERINWEMFDYQPYSLGLAPSDYHLFTHLQNWIGSQRFNNNEELMRGAKIWLSSQAADFFDTGIQKLIPRYYKCLSSGGDCVEKELKFLSIFCIE
jgi:hypothetical protein